MHALFHTILAQFYQRSMFCLTIRSSFLFRLSGPAKLPAAQCCSSPEPHMRRYRCQAWNWWEIWEWRGGPFVKVGWPGPFCDILRLGWCSARCLAESTQSFSERTLLLDLVGELRRFINIFPSAMTDSPTPWSDWFQPANSTVLCKHVRHSPGWRRLFAGGSNPCTQKPKGVNISSLLIQNQ